MSRLVLVRHATSAHPQPRTMNIDGFRAWRAAYEAAGIRADERVPDELARLVRNADLVVSSDAPRAVQSARLIAPSAGIEPSPLLRELDLEGLDLRGLTLPFHAWALVVGLRTLAQSLRGRYPSPEESARIARAVAWLTQLAEGRELVVVVTHASFRRRLARELQQAGWSHDTGPRGLAPWSAWWMTRNAGAER